jgi:hypothetical protein
VEQKRKVFEFGPYLVSGAADATEARRALDEALSGVKDWKDKGFERSVKQPGTGKTITVRLTGEMANQRAFIEIEKRDGTTAKIPRFMIR